MKRANDIVFLIPAAGFSSRMNAFKPLLPLAGKPALAWLLDSLIELQSGQIALITGHQANRLKARFGGSQLRLIFNPEYQTGMLSSVCAGIRAYQDDLPKGFILQPADCPLLPGEVVRQIIEASEIFPDRFIVACYRNKKGHPLYIPAVRALELLRYEGERGLKGFMAPFNPSMVRLDVPYEEIMLDMDTPEDYRKLQERLEENKERRINRFLIVRHGQIQQHAEPIMLGQLDVAMSETGRQEAETAAAWIERRQAGRSIRAIYASDLKRTRETAEIIQKLIAPQAEIILDPGLRERNLGKLDGMFVREFRESYPELYKARGEAIADFKFDETAENQQELAERSFQALDRIRQQTTADGDTVIVTHDGVIKSWFSEWWELPYEQFFRVRYGTGRCFVREEMDQRSTLKETTLPT
ncbi:MAG TPA: NTP transferase domain-containing protein [Clostridiales bacterium]|jgi:CTP:molybdopterin cytidylyltransferase MocA/broad specificity phosphatase PhoE|nr:NTP transferase domain-containing protein [Clostridiales bacterium]